MKAETVRIVGAAQRAHAKRLIDNAPLGYVMKIGAETRRDAQNRKLWPMLTDLQRQVPEMQGYSTDDIKLRFMNALGTEMRFLPVLEGQGMFPVSGSSSLLTVEQFSGLVELIYAYGARHGVEWSEPRASDEHRNGEDARSVAEGRSPASAVAKRRAQGGYA